MSNPSRARSAAILVVLLYLFFLGLDLMGLAFKSFGEDFVRGLVAATSDPFTGLVIGIVATSLIQSSSTTTSMIVGLVAAGALSMEGAIPMVMGANIGTCVTNTLVSLGHAARRDEFRRAFAAATVHDFFNWLTVLVLFPLELATGYLLRTASYLASLLEGSGGLILFDPIKAAVRPASEWLAALFGNFGAFTLILGILCLFLALLALVKTLKAMLSSQAESILHRTLFRSGLHAMSAGLVVTLMVQSSSVTTSMMVPLAGAGVLTLPQIFPFTLGANIGTTITALLAGLATGNPAAITVALAHTIFNVTGTVLFYPLPLLRRIPLWLATKLSRLGSRSRPLAVLYVVVTFYLVPILLLWICGSPRSIPQPTQGRPAADAVSPTGLGKDTISATAEPFRAVRAR